VRKVVEKTYCFDLKLGRLAIPQCSRLKWGGFSRRRHDSSRFAKAGSLTLFHVLKQCWTSIVSKSHAIVRLILAINPPGLFLIALQNQRDTRFVPPDAAASRRITIR
jgi:hypothetical protein